MKWIKRLLFPETVDDLWPHLVIIVFLLYLGWTVTK